MLIYINRAYIDILLSLNLRLLSTERILFRLKLIRRRTNGVFNLRGLHSERLLLLVLTQIHFLDFFFERGGHLGSGVSVHIVHKLLLGNWTTEVLLRLIELVLISELLLSLPHLSRCRRSHEVPDKFLNLWIESSLSQLVHLKLNNFRRIIVFIPRSHPLPVLQLH